MAGDRLHEARRLMDAYLSRTGAAAGGGGDPARRYLWTDAYAVFALLSLHGREPQAGHLACAERLAALVHSTLGRHRADDVRRGWISGLDERGGELHPTAGGLRIGKPLPERLAGEPMSERLEWERDGQYFHYLAKWMLALDRLARAAFEPRLNRFALELAQRAHGAFHAPAVPGRPRRMYWKMSIDLSRPLVASMGHHDPLDGFVTACRVQATRRDFGADATTLEAVIRDDRMICEEVETWTTHDALGLGGLLSSLGELVDLVATGKMPFDPIILRLAADAELGLRHPGIAREIGRPPSSRLPFRELGLAIGLRAVPGMCEAVERHAGRFGGAADRAILRASLEGVARHLDLAADIERAWRPVGARRCASWSMHEDINAVMLAATLLADLEPKPVELRPGEPPPAELQASDRRPAG